MTAYLIRRVLFFGLTLLLTSLIVFAAVRLLPGDVETAVLGRGAEPAARAALREELGLDLPFFMQYGNWLSGFLSGDWGNSYAMKLPIMPLVMERLGNSLRLALIAMLIAVPPSVLLGLFAGLNEGKLFDTVFSLGSLILVGIPEFVMGIILINVVALGWGILPPSASVPPDASFGEALPRLILPSLTAAAVLLAYIGRLTRVGVIAEMRRTYVRTAVLKGLRWRQVIFKHVLRNALLPTITVIAISLGWLISGLVVIENVFAYPGLGRLMVFAIQQRDLPLILGGVMIAVTVFALANLIADLLYAALNPRIRLG
ncbi:MAG: ABC transporter permease [Chloroflexi bacterium CFX4]|nr:ABC transporter permease [Chloroflexi bacterium CFX4]MDL1921936.1 ABC transporter permease [Chloroflexi bacterium CFX3]